MNRSKYFDDAEEKLSLLATRLEIRSGLNILNLNLHSETFYANLLNLLFDWDLHNLNAIDKNAAGIDLVDTQNKFIAQVSSTATKQKIESALSKDLSAYKGYSFKFISISKDASPLRTKTFANPHNLIFAPDKDILDIPALLQFLLATDINRQKQVYDFLQKELRNLTQPEKIESNLTTLITILSKEDWSNGVSQYQSKPYEIQAKISYNHLDRAKTLIEDYKIHHSRIDRIYTEFDKLGANKSLSILDGIRAEYLAVCRDNSPDDCFFLVITNVCNRIRRSSNYQPMPEEELELCAGILVVDAFIRCKIYNNPPLLLQC